MLTPEDKSPAAKPRRRWLQFSLRSLLLLTVAVAVWLGWRVNAAGRQRRAVAAIEASGGSVRYDYQFDELGQFAPDTLPDSPAWLRALAGRDFLHDVLEVTLNGSALVSGEEFVDGEHQPDAQQADRAELLAAACSRLEDLPELRELVMIGVTDADDLLASLKPPPKLAHLALHFCDMTDAGLPALARFPRLRELTLYGNHVTDEGLVHLAKLRHLEAIHIDYSQVTDDGGARLQAALPACQIDW